MKLIKYIILLCIVIFNLSALELNKSTWYSKSLLKGIKCDKLYKNDILTSCYDYSYKGPIYVTYTLDGKYVDKKNIKKRGRWHTIRDMKKIYKVQDKDYVKTGYDRGHLAFDRAFDWTKYYRDQTYILGINCVPQTPTFNRYYWRSAENYAIRISKMFGHANIIDYIVYSNKYIGNHVYIPKTMYKIIYNDKFKTCLEYNNLFKFNKKNKISNFIIDCNKLENMIRKNSVKSNTKR